MYQFTVPEIGLQKKKKSEEVEEERERAVINMHPTAVPKLKLI